MGFNFGDVLKHPVVLALLDRFFEWLEGHAEEGVHKIRGHFKSVAHEPDVSNAINELGYNPTPENLAKLSDKLEEHGQNSSELAGLLLNDANVKV